MKKLSVLASLALILTLTSCSSEEETLTITMSGSTSVEKFAKSVAESYSMENDVIINVQGGGSSAGVPNVVDGISDIGLLSRELKDSEKEHGLIEHVVAIDGIAVIAHQDNVVTDLTLEEINKIYTREITNWSEVGGDDLEIVLVGREAGSGTRDGFETIVGLDDVALDQEFNETGQVIASVKNTAGAIGYISTAYMDKADNVLTIDSVEASVENIQDQSYPLQRNFIMVSSSDSEQHINDFLDYVKSSEGSEIALLTGCIPAK